MTPAALLLLSLASLHGCGSEAPPAAPPSVVEDAPAPARPPARQDTGLRSDIVVMSVDTLRADRLSTWGYARQTSPRLTELAASSRRYTRAYSVSSWTLPSLASLFTVQGPSEHGLTEPDEALNPDLQTLAELAREQGYETAFFGVNPRFPQGHGLDQGFETWEVDAGRSGRAVNQLVRSFLEARDDTSGDTRPLFLVVHWFEPHCRYRAPRDVAERFVDDGVIVDTGVISTERYMSMGDCYRLQDVSGEPELRLQAYRDAYDAEVLEVDGLVHQLWGWLVQRARRSPRGEPWLMLLGDHGEAFWEHGDFGHGRQLHAEQVHVPLLVRPPGGVATSGGEVVEGVVDTVHAAWILHSLIRGIRPPADPAAGAGRAMLETDYGGRRLRSWRGPSGVWMLDLERPEQAVRYDLERDPEELRPEPLPAAQKAMLVEVLAKTREAKPALRQEVSEEQQGLLEALGYQDQEASAPADD